MKTLYSIACCGIMACSTAWAQNDVSLACETVVVPAEVSSPQTKLVPMLAADFIAYSSGKSSVTLTWTTSSKVRPGDFIIMRSANGKNYNAWRKVQGVDHSGQMVQYLEVDDKPANKTSYYKLVQVTPDGDSTYSETRVVRTDGKKAPKLEVYPYVEDETGNSGDTDVLVVLHDAKGNMSYSRAYYRMEDGVVTGISLHQQLPAGSYVITASSKDILVGSSFTIE